MYELVQIFDPAIPLSVGFLPRASYGMDVTTITATLDFQFYRCGVETDTAIRDHQQPVCFRRQPQIGVAVEHCCGHPVSPAGGSDFHLDTASSSSAKATLTLLIDVLTAHDGCGIATTLPVSFLMRYWKIAFSR